MHIWFFTGFMLIYIYTIFERRYFHAKYSFWRKQNHYYKGNSENHFGFTKWKWFFWFKNRWIYWKWTSYKKKLFFQKIPIVKSGLFMSPFFNAINVVIYNFYNYHNNWYKYQSIFLLYHFLIKIQYNLSKSLLKSLPSRWQNYVTLV